MLNTQTINGENVILQNIGQMGYHETPHRALPRTALKYGATSGMR